MKELVRIILPVITPSLNELLRMHWTQRRKLKKDYGWEFVCVGAHAPKYTVKWREKRSLRIMSHRKKLLDYDNLTGGAKPLVDTMVDMGLILDDSPKYADITYFQKVDKDNPHTEIKIFNGGNYGRNNKN